MKEFRIELWVILNLNNITFYMYFSYIKIKFDNRTVEKLKYLHQYNKNMTVK